MATWKMPASARAAAVCRKKLVAAMLLLAATPIFAANENVTAKIALAPLGYPRRLPNRELSGSAMYTLNYIDNTHLLFTFTTHELLRRIPNDPVEDQDRNVAAVLLEVPSGKVIARTVWRLHDYSQYLWDVGDGRFLLRNRNVLTTIAPLANKANPFAEQPMMKLEENLVVADIGITFDRGVMVLEVSDKSKPLAAKPGPNVRPPLPPPVKIQFIRLLPAKSPTDPIEFRLDMAVERRGPTEFSLTSTGFMQVRKEGSYRWGFDFQQYDGKSKKLAGMESSCAPFPVFVSPSEFVSFGCRGSEYKPSLTGFSLKGDIAWQMVLAEPQSFTTLSPAPEAGRFAISRGLGSTFVAPSMSSQILQQEVRVIQSYDGRLLLRVDSSPIQATGQNFALSPDGMSLAVMQDAIVLYALPPLTAEDKKAVAASRELAPPQALDAKVDLSRVPDIPPPPPPEPVASSDALMSVGTDAPDGTPPPPAETIGAPQPDEAEQRSPLVQRRPTIFVPQ